MRVNRSPMVAMTAWWVSQAVVTAPTTTMRPFHSMVLPAVGADLAVPAAVVDLAQRRQHLGAGVGVHRQDRRDVLDDEQAAVADLAEQPAGRILGAFMLRSRGQQRSLAADRAGDDGADSVEPATVSVFALPGPEMISSQTGSLPSSKLSTAAAASMASSASVS